MEEWDMMEEDVEKKDIWKAFDTLGYSTRIGENAGRADQMFYKHLQEGIENNDLDKIYEFINACERGCGVRPDELVCELFQKAYEEDPERLCRILAEKNNVVDYWIFLSTSCETDMLLSFTKMEVPYPHFYYECARILLRRMKQEPQCEEGIVFAVKKLAALDLSLWKRWVYKNEYNMQWQKLVFPTLELVSIEALKTYAQTIHLDMPTRNGELGILSQGFEALQDTSQIYILENISKVIWERWCLLVEQKKEKFDFLKKIWITGYTNLILNSFQYNCRDKEKWKLYFVKYGEMLKLDMYGWYESQTKMISTFFYDVTQLYYILLVGQECHLIEADEDICHCIKNIQAFICRYEYYWDENDKQKNELENRLDELNSKK